jgi:hypothetical protein
VTLEVLLKNVLYKNIGFSSKAFVNDDLNISFKRRNTRSALISEDGLGLGLGETSPSRVREGEPPNLSRKEMLVWRAVKGP